VLPLCGWDGRGLGACRLWAWLSGDPRSSEYATHKTVKARFWPWISGKGPYNISSCPLFARKRLSLFLILYRGTVPRGRCRCQKAKIF